MLGALGDTTALSLDWTKGRERPKRRAGQAQADTRSAVEGGVVTSQAGALHAFVRWFEQSLGENGARELKVLVTGGGAGVILGQSDYQLTHDPLLVFKGMLICRFGPGDQ
jgi:pantothenate kinase type III